MRTASLSCTLFCTLLVAVVSVGCNKDKTAQQSTPATSTDQSTAPTQPPAPPPEQPAAAQQPAAPATEKKQVAVEKPKPAPPAPVAKQEPPKPVVIVVPAGTVLNVRLDQPISTKTNKAGDTFTATLSDGVMVNGATVVPRGARVGGVVADAASAGKMKGSAKLALQLVQLGVGKTPYQISASMAQESKGRGKRTAIAGGGGAGVGAIVGGIAGGGKGAAIGALVGGSAGTVGGAMTGERDISLPAEQSLAFKLEQPIKITLPPQQAAQSAAQ